MPTKVKKSLKKWRPGLNPWTWGFCYLLVIGFAHCSEFDPNDRGLSGFGELTTMLEAPFARREKHDEKSPLLSASKTIEKLKLLPDPLPTPVDPIVGAPVAAAGLAVAPSGAVSPSGTQAGDPAGEKPSGFSIKKILFAVVDGAGLRQNWRLFQLPHPEILGYQVKSYYREVKAKGELYASSFSRCLELDDGGQCSPRLGGRLELEMLREMERRRSPNIFEAFTRHWTGRTSQPVDKVFRRYEFIVYRHAFKTSKDFSKRGSAQVLFAKDF
jgi:hypothetical protein